MRPAWWRNYLRVRGEYPLDAQLSTSSWELPPRARRIRGDDAGVDHFTGTTSACAENTARPRCETDNNWNYLRVRGEYTPHRGIPIFSMELPPRARRIPVHPVFSRLGIGTTSACAENTIVIFGDPKAARNYLRVRGEYSCTRLSPGANRELPPRARRIQ